MDRQHRLQLAHRIHLGLMRELGQGIDIEQMLSSALYARDVLLVCQAYPTSELPWLGEQFRQASDDPSVHARCRPDRPGARQQRLRRVQALLAAWTDFGRFTRPLRAPRRAVG